MRVFAALLCFLPSLLAAELPAVNKVLSLFDQLRNSHTKVRFNLTESEINDYLRYAQRTNPRPGLDSLTVKAFPNNYLSTFTVLDFDDVEKWRPGTIPLLLKPVLSGKKSVWVDVRLNANNGLATFSVEKAYFGNVRLPAVLVTEVINIVGARQREKYDTSKPVPLPFGLRNVWTNEKALAGEN